MKDLTQVKNYRYSGEKIFKNAQDNSNKPTQASAAKPVSLKLVKKGAE